MLLRRFLLLVLPLVLLLGSGALLGCYFETNDDLTIVDLLRGNTAAAPVTDLYLYFHGFAAVWSRLYAAAPLVPWYGFTLYGLLYAATVLLGAVLWRLLRPHAGPALVLAVLVLLWGVAWLEHGFWFNYMRVPLLLAGAGVLFAAQRAPVRWALAVGVLAFGLSWLIRPSAAVLGAAAAAPGAWALAGRRAGPVLGAAAAWAVVGALWLNLTWPPAAATFRRLDVLKSNLNDFQLAAPPLRPLSAPDSLGLAAARAWFLSDSTLVNEALLAQVAPFRLGYFLHQTAPAKLRAVLHQLPRDYFPVLLLLAATGVLAGRRPGSRGFWLVQLGYAGLLLGLGTGLKLPPRLALPLLDFWLVTNLVIVFQRRHLPAWALPGLLVLLGVVALPYAYKTGHRRQVLAQERLDNEQVRNILCLAQCLGPGPNYVGLPWQEGNAASVLVSDVVEVTYKSASPFSFGGMCRFQQPKGAIRLALMGWQTLHPSQPALRQHLTGTRSFPEALRRLGARSDVAWLLSREGAALLNRQLALSRQSGQPLLELVPAPANWPTRKNTMHAYYMRAKFPH